MQIREAIENKLKERGSEGRPRTMSPVYWEYNLYAYKSSGIVIVEDRWRPQVGSTTKIAWLGVSNEKTKSGLSQAVVYKITKDTLTAIGVTYLQMLEMAGISEMELAAKILTPVEFIQARRSA